MLRRLNKRSKGQSTAEYAILIGLVIAAAVAMQIYVKRGLQARAHEAVKYMVAQSSNVDDGLADKSQYEPYYVKSNFIVNRTSDATVSIIGKNYESFDDSTTNRVTGGAQEYTVVEQE